MQSVTYKPSSMTVVGGLGMEDWGDGKASQEEDQGSGCSEAPGMEAERQGRVALWPSEGWLRRPPPPPTCLPLFLHQTTFPGRWRLKPIVPVRTGQLGHCLQLPALLGLPGTRAAWLGTQQTHSTKQAAREFILQNPHCLKTIFKPPGHSKLHWGIAGGLFKTMEGGSTDPYQGLGQKSLQTSSSRDKSQMDEVVSF